MFFYGCSDVGRKRRTNQDSFAAVRLYDNAFLAVVCDGMGGANGGNIASALAVKVFVEQVKKQLAAIKNEAAEGKTPDGAAIVSVLVRAVRRANEAVYFRAVEEEALKGMGTTLVAALVVNGELYVLNVGDSRLYRIEDGKLRKITKDHSYVQYLLDRGEISESDAEKAGIRNIIIRSVGTEEEVEPDAFAEPLNGEGFLLLCTDGLTNYVSEEELLKTVLAPCEIGDITETDYELEDKTKRLIELANEGGGGDNITAVLMKYGTEKKETQKDPQKRPEEKPKERNGNKRRL
ncbi:MAG: Stp1/IreP family PP2C-type Ser/Thr phosphatase [Lachnospiraceae bacterium]|nr:Stp1/IreP family PP2C-type Ser/Thr phosphatase [Lachnospiraceae bacterium]